MAKRRRRGVVLTPEGLQKFQAARLKSEADNNYGERYTYEKLSDITYLDIHTIKRVIECQEGVDKRTIERLFISFDIELTDSCFTKPNPHKRQNWGEAMCVDTFYGRTEELSMLESWLLRDRCRVINILAMGGMGKTCLSVKLAQQVQDRFDLVMWCSLRDAPPVDEVVSGIIEFFSDGKETTLDLPDGLKGKISKLIEYLRNLRCLLVLDNMEALLCEEQRAGQFREGHEGYEDLLRRLGDTNHQSSVLITTREKPKQVAVMEGEDLPVRTFRLHGLTEEAGEQVLKIKGLTGSDSAYSSLVNHYGGNALALKVVAATIRDLFAGDIHDFLEQETAVFGDIRDLLRQQFDRLTDMEREIVYWLAINREPLSIEDIRADMVSTVPKLKLLEGLESLSRRSLVERDDSCFGLQNVVMEYVICRFIERVSEEIISLELKLFRYHAVIKATAKDYIRETQIRLIMEPVLDELMTHFKSKRNVEKRLNKILTVLRETFSSESCYAGGNVLNMLCHMGADFTGYDFSNLTVWEADFRNSCFHDVNLANADLSKSLFTETFGGVLSVAFSPDGKLLAAGDTNGEIRLYRVRDLQQISSIKGHNDWVTSVIFSPDGRFLVTSSQDHKIKLWDSSTWRLVRVLGEHKNGICSLAFNPDGQTLASASDDHTVKIWHTNTGQCLKTLEAHKNLAKAVTFSLDGQKIISGGFDHTIKIWDINTGQCLKTLEAHDEGIWSFTLSPDGQTLASASSDHTVRLWDLKTGECIRILQGHKDVIFSVTFSPDGQTLASASLDKKVIIWSISDDKYLKILNGHHGLIRAVAYSPDGNIIVSGGEDQSLKLWDSDTQSCFKTLRGYSNSILSVSLSTDNRNIASSSSDQTIKLWNIDSKECIRTFEGHSNAVRSVTFSPDELTIASGSDDNTLKIWDRKTGNLLKTFSGHESLLWSVVFSPNGRFIASGSFDSTVKLWDVKTGMCIRTFRDENHGVLSVVFSPNGKFIYTGGTDNTIKVWDIESGQCLKTLHGHSGWVFSIFLNSNEQTLYSGSTDKTIKMWNIESGQCLKTLHGHLGWVWSVALCPNNQILASGSTDNSVKLWDIRTGECLKTLREHSNGILSVAFSSKGHTLISSSEDETIRIWDVLTGECLEILESKKPYEGMNLNNISGLTDARVTSLKVLGALV